MRIASTLLTAAFAGLVTCAPRRTVSDAFVDGLSTTHSHDVVSTFFDGGQSALVSRAPLDYATSTIHVMARNRSGWTDLGPAPFSGQHYDAGGSFAAGDSLLYFTSHRSAPGEFSREWNLWRVTRRDASWGQPMILPSPVNSSKLECCAVATRSGWLYFSSNRAGSWDIYRIALTRAGQPEGEAIRLDSVVNSRFDEWPSWVSSNGAMLIFSSIRPDGVGGDDIYVARGSGERFESLSSLDVNSPAFEDGAIVHPSNREIWISSRRRSPARDSTANVYRFPWPR